ncbi:MAG: WecB/TagA/CpsF family glycosyltransferase [Chitinophagales bacterium]|nr:WecB/TagA/CpsF family glycosyltransferase [Chitinophagales bacterium]
MESTMERISNAIEDKKQIHHTVVNAHKLVSMKTNPVLRESVVHCDIINADGMSVVWASKFLNRPLPERVAGIDLMQNLVDLAHRKNYKIYFFGAKEEIVKDVVSIYSAKYTEKVVAGYRNGYFNKGEEEEIARQIAGSGANILFVAISSPTKEIFLNKYKHILKDVNFIMGVGGSFDVVAGKVKRAPEWLQKAGLEWFYRFLQEPGRMWKRNFDSNSKFIWMVFKEKFKGER